MRIQQRVSTIKSPFGHYEKRAWPANPGAPGGRRNRRGGSYNVFVPHPIANHEFTIGSDAASALGAAVRGLERLSGTSPGTASLEVLAHRLLRSESAASSRIEGRDLSQRRLARAEFLEAGGAGIDNRSAEVLGNLRAMSRAIELGASAGEIDIAAILGIHETLLRPTSDRDIAGVLRSRQNWIGGNDYSPLDADFVPPPPDRVAPLLDDLCGFIGRDDLPPVAQAAIAHAQFENIHPFADGNGRVGRALVYAILRRRDEISAFVPPMSLVMAGRMKTYIAAIGAFRSGSVDPICQFFGDVTAEAARRAGELADAIDALEAQWIERLGNPRRDAAVRIIARELPARPVLDIAAARKFTGRSHVAVGAAINQLAGAGILVPLNDRKWGRAWECKELIELVVEFERVR